MVKRTALAAWVGAFLLLLPPGSASAQDCWTCRLATNPPDLDCVARDSGRQCTITCADGRCRCVTSFACEASVSIGVFAGASDSQQSSSTAPSAEKWLREGVAQTGQSLSLGMNAQARAALRRLPEPLQLTLELANRDGRLEPGVTPHAVYLDKRTRDSGTYTARIAIEGSIATIELELLEHPTLQGIRGTVWNAGNSGMFVITDRTGAASTVSW